MLCVRLDGAARGIGPDERALDDIAVAVVEVNAIAAVEADRDAGNRRSAAKVIQGRAAVNQHPVALVVLDRGLLNQVSLGIQSGDVDAVAPVQLDVDRATGDVAADGVVGRVLNENTIAVDALNGHRLQRKSAARRVYLDTELAGAAQV